MFEQKENTSNTDKQQSKEVDQGLQIPNDSRKIFRRRDERAPLKILTDNNQEPVKNQS